MIKNNNEDKIKVLIVDDSPSARKILRYILESDPLILVTGMASNGREALKLIASNKPDIITMDMCMPVMDGEECTRLIMETNPIPIVVITASITAKDVKNTYRALEAGALAVIQKPTGLDHPEHQQLSKEIIRCIKSLAHIKLIKRKRVESHNRVSQVFTGGMDPEEIVGTGQSIRHVAIGASTGGPPVIQNILQSLPTELSASIYLVQHITKAFQNGFVDWLSATTPHDIVVPENATLPIPGQVYLAPAGSHMGINSQGRIQLIRPKNVPPNCPSVSHLFRSLAENVAENSMAVLLTGMGKDGAKELLLLKEAGGITVAQDKKSSVIFGMPGEAFRLGAAQHNLTPDQIARLIFSLIGKNTIIKK